MTGSEDKGEWAKTADEGIVPAEAGGTDAPEELLDDDPELGSAVTGRTAADDEPATEAGIDDQAGEQSDAVSDGGSEPPAGTEPDLKDASAAAVQRDE